jgi:hypothetical protein
MAFILRSNNTPAAKKADPKANNLMVKESTSVKVDKQIPLMSGREKEGRRQAQMKERQGNLSTYKPQGALSKVMEIAGNPLTAFGYKARNEQLPDNFSKGTRNTLDSAVDIINPVSVAKEGYNAVKETGKGIYNATKGNFSEAGSNLASGAVSALSVLPAVAQGIGTAKGFKFGMSKNVKLATEVGAAKEASKIRKPKKLQDFKNIIEFEKQNALMQGHVNTDDLALKKMSDYNVKQLAGKYKKDFAKEFGDMSSKSDLELYGRMRSAGLGKKDPKTSLNTANEKKGLLMYDLNKLSKFASKHKYDTKYSEEDKVLNEAFTVGYDTRISQRDPSQVYLPGNHNSSFYEKSVSPKFEKLVTRNKLKKPETLYRGDYDYAIENVDREGKKLSLNFSDLQVGDVWEPKKFMSTTIDKTLTPAFGNVQSQIIAPKGQSALVSNLVKGGGHTIEQEVILPSKLKFRVEKRIVGKTNDKSGLITQKFKHSIVNPYVASGAIGGSIMFNKNKK